MIEWGWLGELRLVLEAVPWLGPMLSILVGASTGSFLNMMVHRLPLMAERRVALLGGVAPEQLPGGSAPYNLAVPRSHCPACQCPIPAWHNIPLLSYLWLRGCCAGCGARIPARYLWLELMAVVLFSLAAWRVGGELVVLLMLWVALGCWLAALCLVLEHDWLPTAIAWWPLWLGLLSAVSDPVTAAVALWAAGGAVALVALWLRWRHRAWPEIELLALAAAAGAWGGWVGLVCLVVMLLLADRWPLRGGGLAVPLVLASIAAALLVA